MPETITQITDQDRLMPRVAPVGTPQIAVINGVPIRRTEPTEAEVVAQRQRLAIQARAIPAAIGGAVGGTTAYITDHSLLWGTAIGAAFGGSMLWTKILGHLGEGAIALFIPGIMLGTGLVGASVAKATGHSRVWGGILGALAPIAVLKIEDIRRRGL